MVKISVPATSANLGPGFDTIGMALDMYNTIEVTESTEHKIAINGEGVEEISCDQDNIVCQALAKVYNYVGKPLPKFHIILDNQVPTTRGLGSSAAAVSGGVFAANELLGRPLSEQTMAEIVTEIEGHPDNVVPALLGGIIIAGWGHKGLIYHRIVPDDKLCAVVAIPDFYMSTKKARQALPEQVPFQDALFNLNRAALLTAALITGDQKILAEVMDDKLHQPYRSVMVPGMYEVIKQAKAAGAIGTVLSGAGPTMLSLVTNDQATKERVAQAMKQAFAEHQVVCSVHNLQLIARGASVV